LKSCIGNGTVELSYGTAAKQVQWRRDKVQELCSKGYNQERYQVLEVGLARIEMYQFEKSSQNQRQKIH
jgi:hypothetical protein